MAERKFTTFIKEQQKAFEELKAEINNLTSEEEKIIALQDLQVERQRLINRLNEEYVNLTRAQKKLRDDLIEDQKQDKNVLNEKLKTQREYNLELKREIENRQKIINLGNFLLGQLKEGWKYLQEQDKTIRTTILNLGMSGAKAALMRSSFEQSAGFVASLGGSLEDIQAIMTGFADETGRARVLSAEMVKDIESMAKGTGLGIEQATKLAAQFELIGVDVRSAMNFTQGVVDTSERMGINTTKVLKNITDNFKKLQTYNFQQGVRGFAEMAEYAEKMRIDLPSAFAALDATKTLEGTIDAFAQLQVMGGEFAKSDPLQMFYLRRNDPAQFTKNINEMTKGMVVFKKNAEGVFERFISPADRDRLAAVEKALGMQAGTLTIQAERMADIQKMRKEMSGLGLSSKERELVEGAAMFNSETGKFQVLIGTHMKDINSLTREQASSFIREQSLLKDRAKEALTFDKTFQATINSLKAALLPILHTINGVLTAMRPITDKLSDIAGSKGGVVKAGLILLAGAGALKLASVGIGVAGEKLLKFAVSKIGAKTVTDTVATIGERGVAGAGGGAGMGMLRGGAGIGLGALGAGAGIGVAAVGISKLADAMNKLDEKKVEALRGIVRSMSAVVSVGAAAAAAILIFGTAAEISAGGILAVGAAALMAGEGINLAASGIAKMAENLTPLVTASKDAGWGLAQVGVGILAINAAMATGIIGTVGGVLGGFWTMRKALDIIVSHADGVAKVGEGFKNISSALVGSKEDFSAVTSAVEAISKVTLKDTGVLSQFAKNADAISRVGEGFKNIGTALTGNKEDFIAVAKAVDSISKANVKGGGMLAELATLLKSPLKVEFADKNVQIKNDLTLNIDGHKFMTEVYNVQTAAIINQEARGGKISSRPSRS